MLVKLQKEIDLLKNMEHKNIVKYIDSCQKEDGTVNIYMELMTGGSISTLLKQFGPFEEDLIKKFTKQMLEGLDYLHSNHILHSDLKGANMLFDGIEHLKLADFGAARHIQVLPDLSMSQSSVCTSIKGSLYWMAPEMVLEQGYGRRVDIWSLGCCVIEMATAQHPWPATLNKYSQLVMEMANKRTPPVPDHLSETCQDFIRQCLQYDSKLRPRAKELLNHPFITNESE